MSLEWRLKPGFGTQKKVFLSLNRDVPSIEATNKKGYVREHFPGTPLNFPFNSDVSREDPLVIDIRLNSNKSYNDYKLQSIY